MLPISFLGFAVGAAYGWGLEANRDLDVPAVVSTHAFRDPTGNMGRVAADLGNVYQVPGMRRPNSSALFWTLQRSFAALREQEGPMPDYAAALEAIDRAMEPLAGARMQRPDAPLIVAEYEHTARLMRHACRRGLLLVNGSGAGITPQALDDDLRDIIREYRRLWLARNRPGGLNDSVARLEAARADYQPA
jgi:hypothetical protein